VHICANETIGGVEYHWVARHRRRAAGRRHVVEHPVAPIDVARYGLIYGRRAEEHRPGRASRS
jgi:phosphoserine aminotransferase